MKDSLKQYFPLYTSSPDLAYFDTGASALKPQVVIDKIREYYSSYGVNIHRGLYEASDRATTEHDNAREIVATFINAEPEEIVFIYGTTHGLNMLATSLGQELKKGDNIVLTAWEHHANLIPWQQIAKNTGAELRFVDIDDDYQLDIEDAKKKIDSNTKIVSFGHVSNTLGSLAPAKELIALAKQVQAITIIDAAQSIVHLKTDVKKLDVDFLVFSGHKLYGPTGIGVLYGKKEKLAQLSPVMFGGDMILDVSYDSAEWNDVPYRFESGTPNIAGAIGLGAAVKFIESIGLQHIQERETKLTSYLINQLSSLPNVQIIGSSNPSKHHGVISIHIPGIHTHDIAEILNRHNVAIRVGSHCAMPLMKKLGLPGGTARFSVGMYNDEKDVDTAMTSLKEAIDIFK
ncbi:MAG: cysteine desulfurase [Candidatus Magasanikbacteria bacterium CG_4_9_14_0_2_um_filter_42_11]|uniref:Cysteine desulfurase n=2 Tax=Candidatus Magasanikiibacteriota TaxID=1752731 RepID=A0A2M8F9A5_9BACT|nr:MAG: cysteine desulfurase [Candidatus Magasanikbacteria bacterium CG10_big_fil_rev_8_21_14_0_10_43_9]PIZ93005.1 MAG: cysteine desulfurase [Candidatus Magasanikbacteria bacterium CG_4_10_14_0_2_um_filter_41_10]PJC52249.1 MAG: cysteine desulfurase [Candidatus Magasanikbacteria bacterium CG_4_9_14_0_2_um_filter_42_11]